ncbi:MULTISPECIES: hypothetical protein [unclassified Moorena]|uniref:hypothetical protein n=1 Tax=unclassified Moorena TaxID=2683338 RepID=UPI0025E3B042|nr:MULTISPECIES: hypothetical protein [unclassified Moorena]
MGSKPLLLRYYYINTLVLKRQGHGKTIASSQFKGKNGASGCSKLKIIKGWLTTIALSQFLIWWDVWSL